MNTNPNLWITYAWADNANSDFTFLTQELHRAGIHASFDRVSLVPGRDLWEQIATRLVDPHLDGWAYLLTQASLASNACKEELSYAITRAICSRGRAFPLIGLLHGVDIADVPLALRARLCVSLANPDWREAVLAGLQDRPPLTDTPAATKYCWALHPNYLSDPKTIAIEVRPRFGEVMYWRLSVPYE